MLIIDGDSDGRCVALVSGSHKFSVFHSICTVARYIFSLEKGKLFS